MKPIDLAAALLLLAVASCAVGQTAATSVPTADNTATNQRDRSDATVQPTDQPNDRADINLAAAVRQAIVNEKSLSTLAHNVKLVAVNGVVTLRGPVHSSGEKAKVGQIAASVGGVSAVDNQLDIKTH